MFLVVCVFDNVSLIVYLGEIYLLMGENGVGKLMLMKILLGVYCVDVGGEILIDG